MTKERKELSKEQVTFYCYQENELNTWLEESIPLSASENLSAFSDQLLRSLQDNEALSDIFPFRRYLLATLGEDVVARIGVVAKKSDQIAKKGRVFFGFFYVKPGYLKIGSELLKEVATLCAKEGYTSLRGPVSIHPELGSGYITDDRGIKPVLSQDYNTATLLALEKFAYISAEEFHNGKGTPPFQNILKNMWSLRTDKNSSTILKKLAEATNIHNGLHLRKFNHLDDRDIEAYVSIYNDANYTFPNFVPMTTTEASFIFREALSIEPRCSTIAELDGEPIGIIISSANINRFDAISKEKYINEISRRIYCNLISKQSCLRVVSYALRRAYRGSAIGALAASLWNEMVTRATAAGYHSIITPAIDHNDQYLQNAAKLLGLRRGCELREYLFSLTPYPQSS